MENWRDIPGHEGRYQVSDQGRVRGPSGKVLKTNDNGRGYLQITISLYPHGKQNRLVHRLVAQAFKPNPEHLPEGVKANCAADNLEWTTRLGNVAHAAANGLRPEPTSRAVIGTPIAGGAPVRFESQVAAEIALTGRPSSAVHHCLVGKKKSAYGYRWERAA
jgi:hypothetical protein